MIHGKTSGGKIIEILKNLAQLIKMKIIVTLVVISVFAYLAIRGDTTPDDAMIVILMVVSFYFGTQHDKKDGAEDAQNKALRYLMLYIIRERCMPHIRAGEITVEDCRAIHHWYNTYHLHAAMRYHALKGYVNLL